MFQVGDYIIYGTKGVCKVIDVGPLTLPDMPSDRDYYTLELIYNHNGRVFTPVDNAKVIMRPILSKKEAEALVSEAASLELIEITDEKHREDTYRDVIRSCDCRELVRIIKTLHARNQSRLSEGKKITSGDDRYFHLAEDSLYNELALSLGMPKEAVRSYLFKTTDGPAVIR